MTPQDRPDRMLRAALKYASYGWHVFPLREYAPDADKNRDSKTPHPVLGSDDGHRLATTAEATIRELWGRHPKAGIGCWLQPSGLIALDVDPRDGGDIKLAKLEAEFGDLETPLIQVTGSGGQHYLFRAPANLAAPPGKLHRQKGLDLKWNGYIVLAPSTHPNGTEYAWPAGRKLLPASALPIIPDWTLTREVGTAMATVNGHGGDDDDPFSDVAPIVGFDIDKIAETLALIPNDADANLDYEDWLKVVAGIFHETSGSSEGYEAALAWSSQSPKHDDRKFRKSWDSLNIEGKGRQPVTFRYAMMLAKPLREVANAEALDKVEWAIAEATDIGELRAAARLVKLTPMDDFERNRFREWFLERYKAVTGVKLPLGEARRMLRKELPDGPLQPIWLEGWCYLAHSDTFYNSNTAQELSGKSFNRVYGKEMLTKLDKAEGRAVPEIQPADGALNLYGAPIVHNRLYMPGAGPFFRMEDKDFVNMFQEGSVKPRRINHAASAEERGAVRLVESHFHHLVSDPREADIIISWFASLVQTQRRPNWSVVMQGPENDGKTFFYVLMGAMLGSQNVGTIGPTEIQEGYTAWAEGRLLNVVEEIKLHGHNRFDVLNKVKPYITNPVVPVRRMYTNAYPAPNTSAYLLLTNFRDALPIGDGDSRYFMTASPRQTREQVEEFAASHRGYYDRLYGSVDDHADAIRDWLHSWKLHPEFNAKTRAPWSQEKQHAAALNMSDDGYELAEILACPPAADLSSALFNVTRWVNDREEHGQIVPQTNTVRALMTGLGFAFLGKFRIGGTYCRYWTKYPELFRRTDAASRIRELSETEIF